jgi:hypothetical protein
MNPIRTFVYYDANNLYAHAQTQPLPVGGFRFLTEQEIDKINFLEVPDDNEVGYVLECDLLYPKNYMKNINMYPLAPETLLITQDLISPYCQSFNNRHVDCKKKKKKNLCPNLSDKTKYICYYRNLKFYVKMGMKLAKIHRVVSFTQKNWMALYIQFNTEKRKAAKTDFFVNFWKLMNVQLFGKPIEQCRNRKDLKLVCDVWKVKKKLIATPTPGIL